MKHLVSSLVFGILAFTLLPQTRGQGTNSMSEAEEVLRDYVTAMSKRDVAGLQAVLHPRFTAIEADKRDAKVHLVDTTKPEDLLPPSGNNDWSNVEITSVQMTRSSTHPSVAMASFNLSHPLGDEQVAKMKETLQVAGDMLKPDQRQALSKIVADRAVHNAMFAMLVREEGKWKIVSMTFPK